MSIHLMQLWTTRNGGWSLCQMNLPSHLQLTLRTQKGSKVLILEGARGKSELPLPEGLTMRQKREGSLSFRYFASRDARTKKKVFLTFLSLLEQRIKGLTQSFTRQLQLVGVGYRANLRPEDKILELRLGYSHLIEIDYEDDITILCPNQRTLIIKGVDLPKVSQKAAEIRNWRLPEPYKGKGIFYKGERLQRKEGKKN